MLDDGIYKNQKVVLWVGITIICIVVAYLSGYWRGGREVRGNDTGTAKLMDAVESGQQQTADNIQQAAEHSGSAGVAIDSAVVISHELRESVSAGQRGNAESADLIRTGLEICRRDEQIISAVELSNKKGAPGGEAPKAADGVMVSGRRVRTK